MCKPLLVVFFAVFSCGLFVSYVVYFYTQDPPGLRVQKRSCWDQTTACWWMTICRPEVKRLELSALTKTRPSGWEHQNIAHSLFIANISSLVWKLSTTCSHFTVLFLPSAQLWPGSPLSPHCLCKNPPFGGYVWGWQQRVYWLQQRVHWWQQRVWLLRWVKWDVFSKYQITLVMFKHLMSWERAAS